MSKMQPDRKTFAGGINVDSGKNANLATESQMIELLREADQARKLIQQIKCINSRFLWAQD